jgi:hypothetical protein
MARAVSPPVTSTPAHEPTAVLDEEKNMAIDSPAYRAQLPLTGLEATHRTEVSPDRATALCDTARMGARGRMAEFQMSQTRKYALLTVFCLGVFIDGEWDMRPWG